MKGLETSKSIHDRVTSWKVRHQSQIREFALSYHLLRRNTLSIVGSLIISLITILAIFPSWIATHDPYFTDLTAVSQTPNWRFFFGTDFLGRDIFSRVVWAARFDLYVCVVVVAASTLIGIVVGLFSGFIGGWVDVALGRVIDIFYAIPGLILAMAIAAAIGDRGLNAAMLALIVVYWPWTARLVRGEAIRIRQELYVEAAKALGIRQTRIIFRHVLPNCVGPLTVSTAMCVGSVILSVASLAFIGFGARPGEAEWGRMVADVMPYVSRQPWMAVFPGLAIGLAVFGFTLVGDALRDILDPRFRRRVV